MKIVHVCFSGPYIDNWGYQDNLLPQYLSDEGIENYVITGYDVFPSYLSKDKVEEINKKGMRYSIKNVNIIRLRTRKLTTSLMVPYGLKQILNKIKPDVIFHHGVNCTSLFISAHYCKYNSCCRLFVDNHADELNISKNKIWVSFYHKFLLKSTVKLIGKYVVKYYGVSVGRCNFLTKYYGINGEKVDLLPIGADTKASRDISSKKLIREKYGFAADDMIVVSGGKMGISKGTDILINAISDLNLEGRNILLVLFGKFEDRETEEMAEKYKFIKCYGWCDRKNTLELLKLGDIACWPIHHTTLIEDAVSVGTPLILRKTVTTEHLIDGNGFWINSDLSDLIKAFFDNNNIRNNTYRSANSMMTRLSYSSIVQKLISDISANI